MSPQSDRPADRPVAQRIVQLLRNLGIARAHFGAQIVGELAPVLAQHPEMVGSLALIGPNRLDGPALAPLGSRLLLVGSDRGLSAEAIGRAGPALADAKLVAFDDYFIAAWTDVVADQADAIADAMLEFLAAAERDQGASVPDPGTAPGTNQGEVAGITYQAEGAGPALVLLPLLLAPSQWQPVVDRLAAHYRVITLGGPDIGMVAVLEDRGRGEGYLRVIRSIVDELALSPGDKVLDVGCGTGAIDRWLAGRTGRANPITAVDRNPYLLGEARALAAGEGLDAVIDFRHGDAVALPFPADGFDATISFTVMEECDADAMLAEMIRVTRPGGQVAVMVRAVDLPSHWNLPLPEAIKAKVEAPVRSVAEAGCADASLYRRFRQSPLVDLKMFPHVMTNDRAGGAIWQFHESFALSLLDPDETIAWQAAKAAALAEGTLFFARPHHCAIGTKPG